MEERGIPPLAEPIVQAILCYLVPPTASPIPVHLLSEPLQQRHHFLGLTPDDPQYFSWPSPAVREPAAVLERLAAVNVDRVLDSGLVVGYQADAMLVKAVATLEPELHLVFILQLDDIHVPWRFHNVLLSPLVSHHHPSPSSAVAAVSAAIPQTVSPSTMDGPLDDNAASYWEGYDSPSPSSPGRHANIPLNGSHSKIDEEERAEREYWARYGAVQGTADSELPSPAPESSKHAQKSDTSGTRLMLRPSQGLEEISRNPSHAQIAQTLVALPSIIPRQANTEALLVNQISPTGTTMMKGDSDPAEEVVRSLFRMWKTLHPSANKSDFIAIVQKALS